MPWPDETTQIFKETDRLFALSCQPTLPAQWSLFAEGYHEAAEQLYTSWHASGGYPDSVVFPMVFLYRHYVELRIKELIQRAVLLLALPSEWPAVHGLVKLWDFLRPLLEQIWPTPPSREIINATRLIQELAALDNKSMVFRYPSDKEGVSTTKRIELLDVNNFFQAMRQLAAFLDGVSMQISVYLDDQPGL